MIEYQPQVMEYIVITVIGTKVNSAILESLEIEQDLNVHQ